MNHQKKNHIEKIKVAKLTCLLLFGFMMFFQGFSQDKSKLNSQISQLEKEIAYTNSLIQETKKTKDVSIIQIKLIDQQIKKQEKLLKKLRQEIQYVDQNISNNQLIINQKKEELDALKEEYAKMIVYSRKNLNQYDRIMFVFASQDFNQAFKRLNILNNTVNTERNR